MDQRPSFIVIMTDQQRGDALSAAGHLCLLTPNGVGAMVLRADTFLNDEKGVRY